MSLRDRFRAWRRMERASSPASTSANSQRLAPLDPAGGPAVLGSPVSRMSTSATHISHVSGSQSDSTSTISRQQQPSKQRTITVARPDPRQLWEEAFDSLQTNPGTAKLLTAYEAFVVEFSESGSVENARAAAQDRTWTTRNFTPEQWMELLERAASNATNFMERRRECYSTFRNILQIITKAKDTLVFAASFEPHAAIAWAGISAFLPVS